MAEAVLIRGISADFGVDWMRERRCVAKLRELTNGPAKLCAALGIDRRFDGLSLCGDDGEVVIAKNPRRAQALVKLGPVTTTRRIGITVAADWPLRFCLPSSEFVSRHVR